MKTNVNVKRIAAFLFMFICFISVYSQDYYWHRGQKISVKTSDHKNFYLFSDASKTIQGMGIETRSTRVFDTNLHWAFAHSIDRELVEYVSPAIINSMGDTVNFSNLFYVRLKSEKDIEQLEQMAKEHRVEILGNNEFMPLWYTLSCSKRSVGNALEMANLFYESKLFSVIEVDYLIPHKFNGCITDALSGQQWNLINTGQNGGTPGIDINYCAAKAITTGSPDIIVAVVDGGIDPNHPDITNIHFSYNAETGQSPAPNAFNAHGTQVGGIIGASHNNIGIAGIAPDCRLMSISRNPSHVPNQAQNTANGINWAWKNGASVINNSWGGSGYNSFGTGHLIGEALDSALIRGRNGKGTVVVFASGNDSASAVMYLANWRPEILTVGAIRPNGQRAAFSNFGVALDVVAPGVNIHTTCVWGPNVQVEGTSYAAPHVAGIAALILSVNPNLTRQEVVNIIESTARKVRTDLYTYTNNPSVRPNGTWNNQMGYGLVDAGAAVRMALCGSSATTVSGTINTNRTVYGSSINTSGTTTVQSNRKLTLKGCNSVTLNEGFTVESGAALEIRVGP